MGLSSLDFPLTGRTEGHSRSCVTWHARPRGCAMSAFRGQSRHQCARVSRSASRCRLAMTRSCSASGLTQSVLIPGRSNATGKTSPSRYVSTGIAASRAVEPRIWWPSGRGRRTSPCATTRFFTPLSAGSLSRSPPAALRWIAQIGYPCSCRDYGDLQGRPSGMPAAIVGAFRGNLGGGAVPSSGWPTSRLRLPVAPRPRLRAA